jgi:cytochrome c
MKNGGHMKMGTDRMSSPDMPNMRMPSMNPLRGRKLFVDKGCVACHAINGVGGHDATNLDAHTMRPMMNPFEFAAKMWAMAPAMIAAQEEALGEQILFTGDELADIVAFVHNDEAQHDFSETDLTSRARKMMDHEHGAPGAGPEAHAEELGHGHMEDQGHGEKEKHND